MWPSIQNLVPVFLSLTSLVKANCEDDEWTKLNEALKDKLKPINFHICRAQDPEDISKLGDQANIVIRDFLLEHPDIFEAEESSKKTKHVKHTSKTVAEAKQLKKELKKKAEAPNATLEDRKNFRLALRAISDLKKAEDRTEQLKTSKHQEGLYFKNKWDFSKKATKGNLDSVPEFPTFSKPDADNFYPKTYSQAKIVDLTKLSWFPNVPTHPQKEDFKPFSKEPIRPRDIRATLMKCNKNSSPGPDGIPYSILLKFPCIHHTLATLFNKVLVHGSPPRSWSESVIKLLHKSGSTDDPTNFRMIALTNCIGKVYHLILANRFTNYLLDNNLIDATMQKAFLPGINGCVEHNIILDEIVKDAKIRKKTVHITFFDLADAFGSVPHNLIIDSLQRNHFPPEIVQYIHQFYSNIQATVHSKNFKSDIFSFKRGVFQGDPLSPIIFLTVFNPILQYLHENSKFGYKLQDESFISLPFADDFCLITTDLRTQQRIINKIDEHIKSMGMLLKPSKCRSFSIGSGKPIIKHFKIGEKVIPSIAEEEQKFLGKVLFFEGKSEQCHDLLKQKIQEKMDNLDKTAVRSEFKIEIYKIYILPSIRFLLTVHDLAHTYLLQLDSMANQYLKKWAGLPRCATTAILHLDSAMNISNISTLYKEAHTLSHTSTRLKGDKRVNLALNNKIERESTYKRKKSVTVQAETIFISAYGMNTVQGEIPRATPQLSQADIGDNYIPPVWIEQEDLRPPAQFIKDVKSDAKSKILVSESESVLEHVQTLIQQGKYLELTKLQQSDATWQSFIFNLPKGTMKWVLNSSINTLPTKTNLKQWGKLVNDKCFCGQRQTLNHVLSCCKPALNQGRFTFRHDNILYYIAQCLDKKRFQCMIDLEGHKTVAGGTIPANLMVTIQRPDIVIIDEKNKSVAIFELTVPAEHRLDTAHTLKMNSYSHFSSDIKTHTVSVIPFEVGSHTGHINNDNKKRLHTLHSYCSKDIKLKRFKENISAISILSSYFIFNCRNQDDWSTPDHILAPFKNQ